MITCLDGSIMKVIFVAVMVCITQLQMSQALIFLSEQNNVIQSGATLTNRHLVTYRCEAADLAQDASFSFQVQAQDGTNTPLQIDCNHIEEDTSPLLWGYIPETTDFAVSDALAVNDPVAYTNITALDEYEDLSDPMGRSLLQLRHTIGNGNELLGELIGNGPMGRKLTGFLDSLKDAALGFTCAGGLGFFGGGGSVNIGAAVGGAVGAAGLCDKGSGGGISQQDLDAVRTTAENAKNALADLTLKENKVSNDLIVLAQLDQKRFELQQSINTDTNTRFRAQQSEILAVSSAQNEMASKLTAQGQLFQSQINTDRANIATIAGQLQAQATLSGDTFQQLAANIAKLQISTNDQLSNTTELFNNKIQRIVDQIRSIVRNLGDFQATFDVFYKDEQFIHMHTAGLQPKQQTWITGGLLDPFVIDQGQVPADPLNLGTEATYLIEVSTLKYIRVDTDGQPWATQTTREFRCSSLYLALRPQLSAGTQQLSEQIGPQGCDPMTEGPTMCRCSVKYTSELTCPMKQSSPGVVDSAAFADYETAEQIVEATHCATLGSLTSTFLHPADSLQGTVATTLGEQLTAESRICLRGSYSNIGAGQTSDVMVISAGKGVKVRTTFTPAVCNKAWDKIVDPSSDEYSNVLTAFYTHLQVAYRLAMTNFEPKKRLIFGRPPDPVTQLSGTYRALPDTSSGRWSQWIMTAHSKRKIPVSIMRQTATSAVPTILVDSVPTIPDSVVLNNPDAIYLPYGLAAVGDMFSDTVAYNQRAETVPINPFAPGRCGTLTYPICGCEEDTTLNPTNCPDDNLGTWEVVNGLLYNHECGIASASQWLVNLDANLASPTYGFCVSGPGNGTIIAGGNWCNLRATHKVEVNRGQNRVTYIPRGASLDVTVAIPEGQIVALQTSQCPAFPKTIPAPGFIGITLQNLAPTNNRLFLTEGPGCTIPPQYTSVVIQAFGSFPVIIPRCTQTPAGQVEHITVFYQQGNSLIACPTVVNVTVSVSDASLFQGVMVEQLRQVTTDQVFSMMHITEARNTAILLQATSLIFDVMTRANIKIDPISLDQWDNLRQNASDLVTKTREDYIFARNQTVTNYTDLLVPYDQRLNEASAIFEQAQTDAEAKNELYRDLNINGSIAVSQLINDTAELIVARKNFQDAFGAFADAITNALSDLQEKSGKLTILEWLGIIFGIVVFFAVVICVCQNCVLPRITAQSGKPPTEATKGMFRKIRQKYTEAQIAQAIEILKLTTAESKLQSTGHRHKHNDDDGEYDQVERESSDSGSDHKSVSAAASAAGGKSGDQVIEIEHHVIGGGGGSDGNDSN